MAEYHNVEIDPAQIENAQKTWKGFVRVSKWGITGIACLLLFLAAALI